MNTYAGMQIIQVEPGTEVEHNGEKATVTDSKLVFRGGNVYVTPHVYELLKAKTTPVEGEAHV